MFITIILIAVYGYGSDFLAKQLKETIRIRNEAEFVRCINEAVSENGNLIGTDIAKISYSEGKISGINYDTGKIVKIKTGILSSVSRMLNEKATLSYKIYFSDALKSPFFSQRGLSFKVKATPTAAVNGKIYGEFKSRGVNQTVNRISLKITASLYSSSRFADFNQKVEYDVLLCETLIAGDVPDTYTNVTSIPEEVDDTILNLQ